MTTEEEKLLQKLETRVGQLTLAYKDLEARLRTQAGELDEKNAAVRTLQEENTRLRADYANLKTARMIDIGSGEMKDAKARFTRLVREVDKCIALLNV